jgi:hypothetical protein
MGGIKLMKKLKLIMKSIADHTPCRVFVAKRSPNRKVLIVADEDAIKNLLILMRKLDSRRASASSGGLDLAAINRRSFDTAILDLRCSPQRPAGRGYGIGEVRPSKAGRVLVINAQVNDQKTFELVEEYIRQRHTLRDLLFDLAVLARTIIGRSPSPRVI